MSTSLLGCPQECNHDYVTPSFRIRVIDGATGEPICDAEVTVDGAQVGGSETTCNFVSPIPEHASAVEITASKSGYQTMTQSVSTAYETDECDKAIAKPVTLTLEPS